MPILIYKIMVLLPHRIGDLETNLEKAVSIQALPHRIGDLEIADLQNAIVANLPHRIGDLESTK